MPGVSRKKPFTKPAVKKITAAKSVRKPAKSAVASRTVKNTARGRATLAQRTLKTPTRKGKVVKKTSSRKPVPVTKKPLAQKSKASVRSKATAPKRTHQSLKKAQKPIKHSASTSRPSVKKQLRSPNKAVTKLRHPLRLHQLSAHYLN